MKSTCSLAALAVASFAVGCANAPDDPSLEAGDDALTAALASGATSGVVTAPSISTTAAAAPIAAERVYVYDATVSRTCASVSAQTGTWKGSRLGASGALSGYCVLGLHPLCPASFGCGMGVLALDELVCPRNHLSKLYVSMRVAVLMTCTVSFFLVCIDLFQSEFSEFAKTLDLYALIFGLCLPLLSHFLMIAVRDSRRFSLGSVVELCEFGLPFAVFLGVFHLCVAYGQRYELGKQSSVGAYEVFLNQSWSRVTFSAQVRTDGPFVLFYCFAPLLVCPFVVGYVSCVLEGNGIDPMLAMALSLCVHFLLERSASTVGVYGVVCCLVAIMGRIMGEFSPNLRPHPLSEPSQLDQQVIWERHARRVEVAEELTRDLGGPEEQVVCDDRGVFGRDEGAAEHV